MPERSRSPQGPRHVAPGGELQPWWRALDARRLRVAVGASFLALPLLVLDNLPEGTRGTAEAVETVETVATPTSEEPTTTSARSSSSTTSTTVAPTTTAAPATTEAPVTTEAPTTAPPTTRAAPPPTTAPPPTAAPPITSPPPPPGSIEAIIHAHFGDAGDEAVAIARCESHLNPNAIGGGGRYFGLFQIGSSHAAAFEAVTGRTFESAWSDPDANARYARWLYGQSGWSPWGCRNEI